jgi:hypothetical protein
MNNSIYMMLIAPYGSLTIVGFLIYRGMRRNQQYLDAQAAQRQKPDDVS